MRILPLLLLVLVPALASNLLPAAPACAGEAIILSDVTVVASTGCPEGLHAFLPSGRSPAPLAWPLPDGPLLILGLPDADPLAFELAMMWGILPPDGDLHGGYVRVAWHDGHRPIAVILGADAAALYAARFELETLPRGGPASTNFTKPPPEGVLQVAGRWHHERPRYRVRAVLSTRRTVEELLEPMVAGRANRVWISEGGGVEHVAKNLLPELRRHGIEPVLVVSPPYTAAVDPQAIAERVARWRMRAASDASRSGPTPRGRRETRGRRS